MHPRSRRGIGRPPLSKKQKTLSFDRHHNHYRPQHHCTSGISLHILPLLVSPSSTSCRLRNRKSCAKEIYPLFSRSFSYLLFILLFIFPHVNKFFTHDCVRKRCRQRIYPDIHPSLLLTTLTRAPVCKSSPYAFAPYAARCASSASLCRHNGDTGTGAPCHIPTSDDSSGCSSACKPCRRPDN